MSNIKPAMNFAIDQLKKEGVPDKALEYAAALLVGQALTESWLNPNAMHDSLQGYGIYGAKGERRDKMFSWLDKNGYDRNSLEGQVRYMVHEAMTDPQYLASKNALMTAEPNNLELGSFTLTSNFEKPKVNNFETRLNNTKKALNEFNASLVQR